MNRTQRGFTLVELMVTVAMIGILAAIAIPNFITYQARARRSEAFANLSSLARAQKGYHAESGTYLDTATTIPVEPTLPDPAPYGGLGTHKMTWDTAAASFFDQAGWAPEGQVHYTYESKSGLVSGCGGCSDCFTAAAHGDVDGDNVVSSIVYVHPEHDASGMLVGSCQTYLGALSAPIRAGTGDPIFDEPAVNASNDDY